jgi:hypothetical protein
MLAELGARMKKQPKATTAPGIPAGREGKEFRRREQAYPAKAVTPGIIFIFFVLLPFTSSIQKSASNKF